MAAEGGDLAAVRAAIAAGADVNYVRKRTTGWQVGEPLRRVETALFMASGNGDADIARELLEAGADPDIICTNGSTALITAAGSSGRGDHATIVGLLLQAGADPIGPRLRGQIALEWAVMLGEVESVRLLLTASRAAQLPADVESRLHSQAQLRQDDLKRVVVKLVGIDETESAILRAARIGSAQDIAELLKAGVDPNTRDLDGWGPLHWAAGIGGDAACTRILLDAGADPSAATVEGFAPLMAAVLAGDPGRIRMLLDAGADPNALDSNGRSALHIAAWHADKDVIRLLIKAGARPEVEDHRGRTPVEDADVRRRNLAEDVTDAFTSGDD